MTTEERVTMKLWKKHRAYIPRRFVVVEVVELVEPSILLIVSTGASPIPDQCAKTGHVIRLTFLFRKVP